MRAYLIFFVSFVALIGGCTAAAATISDRDFTLRGYVDATQSQELPYRLPRLGVNANLTQYSLNELHEQFNRMQAMGVTWVRQIFIWDNIHPEADAFDWQAVDLITTTIADYPELDLVAVLTGTPPDDPDVFGQFTATFARRYGEQISHYQIWNEPNLRAAWGDTPPQPAEYAAILSAAYQSIHAVDEDAQVLLAALAPTTEQGPDNISDLTYLQALYALGAGPYFDAAAAKPYGFNASPQDRTVREDVLNFSRIIALREIMVEHRDAQKTLWASNWGWNSLPEDWQGSASIWGTVDPEMRIDYTLQALQRAEREWPWLGGMILHTWQPDAPLDDPIWGFALISQDDNPTALYQALEEYSRARPKTATNGLYHPRTIFARYSGVWTFSELGADIGWLQTSDSIFELDFSGRDVALLLREGDYTAFLYPQVDNQPANATPHDSNGNAYIFLRSADDQPVLNLVAVSRDLTMGTHTLSAIADRGWDQWALAGFAVSDGDMTRPFTTQLMAAVITTIAAGFAVVAAGVQLPWVAIAARFQQPLNRLNATTQFIISGVTSIALMLGMLLTFGDGIPAVFRRDTLQLGGMMFITGGLIAFQWPALLVIFALLLLFVLIYQRIANGLILTVIWAPFFLFPVELYTFAFPVSELLLLITAGAWGLKICNRVAIRRQSVPSGYQKISLSTFFHRWQLLDYSVLLWLILGCVAILWSDRRGEALTDLRTMILEPALFYLMLRTTLHSVKDWLKIISALVMAGVLVAGIGLILFAFGEAIITAEQGTRRLASVYGSPNNVGLLIGRTLPFALAFLLVLQRRQWQIAAGISVAIMGLAVVLTQSAGALLIGVPVGTAALLLAIYGRRAYAPLLGIAVLGIAVFAILTQVSPRFASLLDFTEGTNFIRLRLWESSLEMISDYPFTGLGLDQFLYAYQGMYIRPDAIWDAALSHPHNILLDFWLRFGLTGLILLLGLQYGFWRRIRVAYQNVHIGTPNRIVLALVGGVIGGMTSLLAHGLIDNSVFVNDLALIFMLMLGLAAYAPQLTNARAIDATVE